MRNTLFMLVFLLVGCSGTTTTDEKGLYSFILDESNGLRQTRVDGPFKIIATYRPSELIAKQQMITDKVSEFDSLKEGYASYLYFFVEISKGDKDLETVFASEPNSFSRLINYMSFDFRDKFKLIVSEETVPATDFIYARSYGISSSQFLVAFDTRSDDDVQLIINGSDLGFGEVELDFSKNDLNRIPTLQF